MVVVTYSTGGTPTPSMSVSPNSIDFGSNNTINPSNPYTETFEVTFANLTENLTITGFSGVTVSPASINYNATSPQTVTVSYNPTAAGSISGNISVNSSEVTEQLVAVTGSAYDPENVDTYEKYTGVIVEGDYVIYANNYALKNTLNNGPRFNNESVTPTDNKITNPDASIIWHIAPIENTNYWTVYNSAINKYAGGTSSKNQGALLDEVTDFAKWEFYYQTSILYIANYGRSQQTNDPNNKFIRQNGTSGWATYAMGTGAAPQLYKKVVADQVAMPTFSPVEGTYFETQSITLSCATDGATIYYTTDGTTPSASNGTAYTSAISVSETMTIKAIAIKSDMTDSDVATATYTISLPLSTMEQIFAAATSAGNTATAARIALGNWVVSGVSTHHVFVTDGIKGFMIYQENHGFAVGDILSGTVNCNVQLYNGSAEITNLTRSTTGLAVTTGGNATVADIDLADLAAINTGALVSYENLTCSVTTSGSYTNYYLTDGTTQIQAYSTLYSGLANSLEDGKTYNITGVFVKNNSTKRVNPRNASDIVEVVTPVTSDKYVKVTSTTDLTSGQYLIVYEDGSVAFDGSLTTLDAASNTISVVTNNNEIGVDNITTAAEFTIDVTNGTLKSASGKYIGVSSNSNGLKQTDNASTYTNSFSIDNNGNAVITAVFEGSNMTMRYNNASNQNRFRYYSNGQQAIQLYKKVVAEETYTLEIAGYGNSTGGYYLIASPVTVDPATVTNAENTVSMVLTGTDAANYDLFYFDQAKDKEWINYKGDESTNNPGGFSLVPGKGYLYAHKTGGNFILTGTPYSGEGIIELVYDDNAVDFKGWNLIGNPFGINATLDLPYYRLNSDGSALNTSTESSQVLVMEGVFVEATSTIHSATFSPASKRVSQLSVNVTRNRSAVLDNAIIRFDEGATLSKFQLNPNSTKVYITQDNQDYAVVRGEEMGEMPVSFKAENNGNYTLSVNAEEVSFAYLHLIDNMTGADVDLLQTPSYSFEAKTTDYESRFKLVFATGDNSNDDNFAFYSNGSFVINNEGNAELQVIDIMGRIVKSESINGCANVSVNGAAGVYMLRLVNGDNVKVQKVVVK